MQCEGLSLSGVAVVLAVGGVRASSVVWCLWSLPALAAGTAAVRGLCRFADQCGRGLERDSPHLDVEV